MLTAYKVKASISNQSNHPIIINSAHPPLGVSSSRYIAKQLLQTYQTSLVEDKDAKIVVVVDNPKHIMPAVRKYWLSHIRSLARERSSTLHRDKIHALNQKMDRMNETPFIVGLPNYGIPEGVFFVEPGIAQVL